MVFKNFWYIEHYAASFGDEFDAKMNYFEHIMNFSYIKHYGARVGDDFVAKNKLT